MSAKDYIDFAFAEYLLSGEFDNLIGDIWIPEEIMSARFQLAFREAVKKFGYSVPPKYDDVVISFYDKIIVNHGISIEGDGYTGRYAKLVVPNKDAYLKKRLASNPVTSRVNRLGPDALRRALKVVAEEEGWLAAADEADQTLGTDDLEIDADVLIPASDRFVTLGHNQQAELEKASTDVIDALEKENSVDGDPSARAWMLGQLKAGRELLRAQILNAWLLEQTVLPVLGSLTEKFKDHAIGAAAAVLMELLIKHIFGIH